MTFCAKGISGGACLDACARAAGSYVDDAEKLIFGIGFALFGCKP